MTEFSDCLEVSSEQLVRNGLNSLIIDNQRGGYLSKSTFNRFRLQTSKRRADFENHEFSIGFVQRESIGAEPDVESVLSTGFAQAAHDGKLDGGRVERRRPHP